MRVDAVAFSSDIVQVRPQVEGPRLQSPPRVLAHGPSIIPLLLRQPVASDIR